MKSRAFAYALTLTAVVVACTGGGGSSDPTLNTTSSSSTSGKSSSGGTSGTDYGATGDPGPSCNVPEHPACQTSSGTPFVASQAIATAILSGATCPNNGDTVSIGSFASPDAQPPTPAEPATTEWRGKSVQVYCTTTKADGGYIVEATVYIHDENDANDGAIGVTGLVPTSNPTETIVGYVKVGKAEYKSKDCKVEYPVTGGVASGRFWANISCPPVDPSGVCAIQAAVRVENCQEK